VRVFFAGSLIIPFEQLEKAYEAKYPRIDLQTEGHGSIQVIRHVTEIHDLIDVVVTADQALIPMLMYTSQVPETGQPYACWNVEFATNRLALAYRPDSRYASEVNADNWYQIIARPGVKLGISDPRFDACGYRALMALQMAEAFYGQPTLFEDLVTASFKPAIRVRMEDGRLTIHVPEIVETKPDVNIVLRGYSIQLIQLMETGNLDYAFEYESVIRQHKLQMLSLPDALNLGVESMADAYGKVQVKLDLQRFATIAPVFRGETIRYAVTIPTNAPHPKEAEDFVAFLLGQEGQRVLAANQQPLVIPPRADRLQELPESLQSLCVAAQ
jgi:molybdate/tungstate transport system substrate-binding protein